MAKTVKTGLLIDSAKRTVTPFSYNGDYMELNRAIGCDTFTVVDIDGHDYYLDDEGLCKGPRDDFFTVKSVSGRPVQPFAGNAVVLDATPAGNAKSLSASAMEAVKRGIRFLSGFEAAVYSQVAR